MSARVLVVDDDASFRLLAEEALSGEGFEVTTAPTLARARAELDRATPDVVVLDRRLPDGDGIDFLRQVRGEGPSAPLFVVVTAYGDVGNAVAALRSGAFDYLVKPVQLTDLVVKLRKVMEARGLLDRLALARTSAMGPPPIAPSSPAMREVLASLERVAQSPLTTVLLTGPSGVGKQFAAQALHEATHPDASPLPPFVDLNCAALPHDLLESELFGHEKGAFTGAVATKRGLIELADTGTLFLDEVTELPLPSQAKLLKFLDSMRFRRLGSQRETEVSLRVVAATNQDIASLVGSGRFREDLYHRIAVFGIAIPPLAARRDDIRSLAESFARYFAARVKRRGVTLGEDAIASLLAYDYPGNVRELRNIIERAVILARSDVIGARDIVLSDASVRPPEAAGEPPFFAVGLPPEGPLPLEDVERRYVARVLEHCGGKRMSAAHLLGISYPTFLKRLRELGMDEPSGPATSAATKP